MTRTQSIPITKEQPFAECDYRTTRKLIQKLDVAVMGCNDWHLLAQELGLGTSEINVGFSLLVFISRTLK